MGYVRNFTRFHSRYTPFSQYSREPLPGQAQATIRFFPAALQIISSYLRIWLHISLKSSGPLLSVGIRMPK